MTDADLLDIVAWNPHVGNSAARVTETLDRELTPKRPDLIVLNEVRKHHGTLAQWAARNGYTHLQELPPPMGDPVPSKGSTALLVTRQRRDLHLVSRRVVPMLLSWVVFSHNQRHTPRRYERVRLTTRGGRWKVTASHWPTNGFTGGNRLAFAESTTRAAAALRGKRPGTVAIDVGDHNEAVSTLKAWCAPLLARVAGHGPDSCIVTGGRVEAVVGKKHGSDHHLMRYEVRRS